MVLSFDDFHAFLPLSLVIFRLLLHIICIVVLSFSIFDVLQMIVVLVCVIPCCRVAAVDELIVIRVDLS